MNATKQIIDILKAMGAAPTVTTDGRGNDLIKVNAPRADAPALDYNTTLFDSDAAEWEYTRERNADAITADDIARLF